MFDVLHIIGFRLDNNLVTIQKIRLDHLTLRALRGRLGHIFYQYVCVSRLCMCLLACVLHTLRLASISRAHSVNFVFLPFLFVVATFMCHASCGSALNDSQKGKVTRS